MEKLISIDKFGTKGVKINDIPYLRAFNAKIIGDVLIVSEQADRPEFSFSGNYRDVSIMGNPAPEDKEECLTLLEFLGNFKAGGGPSETTRVYDNGTIYFSNYDVPKPRDGKTPESAFMHTDNLYEYFTENVDVFSPKGYSAPVYGIFFELCFRAMTNETWLELNHQLFQVLRGTNNLLTIGGKVWISNVRNRFIEISENHGGLKNITRLDGCIVKTNFFGWHANDGITIKEIRNSKIHLDVPSIGTHLYYDTSNEIDLYDSTLTVRERAFEQGHEPPAIILKHGSKFIISGNKEENVNPSATEIHKYDCSQVVWDNIHGKSFAEIYPNVTIVEHGGTV
jgi:hypothetical protein